MQNEFSIAGYWSGDADEAQFAAWCRDLCSKLHPHPVSLGLVFISPRYFSVAEKLLDILRVEARIPWLVGCSGNSLVSGEREIEEEAGISVGLFFFPDTQLEAIRFNQEQVEEWNGAGYWHLETGRTLETVQSWLVFADPFTLNSELWLRQWNDAFPGVPILGGLASGDYAARKTQIYCNGKVYEDGGVALAFSGAVGMVGVISQGCTPIGEAWTITKTERNVILEIGNRPAYQVLFETLSALPASLQAVTRGNLFVGLAMNEYQDDFQRGDFLIRNILAADAETGAIAIGALPRPGQTLQFHRRDAEASSEDMTVTLRRSQNQLSGSRVLGGCLCSCNGRGYRLFGRVHHDAHRVQQAFGPLGLVGFFCNGELGPIAGKNYLHGYTASVALFVEHSRSGGIQGG